MARSWIGRVRGILGTGLTWAAGWSVGGTVLQAVLSMIGWARTVDPLVAPLMWAVTGFLGGVVFGAALGVMERDRSLSKLRFIRMAIWGAVAGVAMPFLYEVVRGNLQLLQWIHLWPSVVIIAPLGALSGVGMVALARRGATAELEPPVREDRLLLSNEK